MSLMTCMCALALALSSPSAAAPENDSAFEQVAHQGINAVYDLEFARADSEFQKLIVMRPHRPEGYFFRAMIDWWRILIDMDNNQYDDRFLGALDGVIAMCDSILDLNPSDMNAVFFKGGAIGFQGRLRFHRDDYLAAANAGRKALSLVQYAQEADPSNTDILLGSGIYNYYADVVPREYPYLKPLMLFVPPGDRLKGIQQLTTAAEKGRYSRVEAAYFLMQIYFYYEKDYAQALDLALRLHGQFDANMLFHKYVGRCRAALSNWTETGRVFTEILARARAGRTGYATMSTEREAEYYIGLAAMNQQRPDSALAHFYRCDVLSRTLDAKEASGFMASCNLKIGMIYEVTGRRELAIGQYRKVLAMKEYNDSHTQAREHLRSMGALEDRP